LEEPEAKIIDVYILAAEPTPGTASAIAATLASRFNLMLMRTPLFEL